MANELEDFLKRHGEIVMQAIVENIERYEGVRMDMAVSLEQRWQRLMQNGAIRAVGA